MRLRFLLAFGHLEMLLERTGRQLLETLTFCRRYTTSLLPAGGKAFINGSPN